MNVPVRHVCFTLVSGLLILGLVIDEWSTLSHCHERLAEAG